MKKLCKLDFKDEENQELAFSLVQKPKFICQKCGRFAFLKAPLCKPLKSKKINKAPKPVLKIVDDAC
jgi:hypothetical protein